MMLVPQHSPASADAPARGVHESPRRARCAKNAEAMKPYFHDSAMTLYAGDAHEVLSRLPERSVDCVVTSPPYYGCRDYGHSCQFGVEPVAKDYVERVRGVFGEVHRVLSDRGTCWLALGDGYATNPDGSLYGEGQPFSPSENLLGIPWRVAFGLQEDGWILRNAVVWHKPSYAPESVRDRLSPRHEHILLLVKQRRYHFDLDPIRSPSDADLARGGRNPGDVWSIGMTPFDGARFAVFPVELPLRCIAAGCPPGGRVLDPFSGAGTTGIAARRLDRSYIGIDLRADYHDLAVSHLREDERARR